ncbi:MAG TPA: hypothetical protein DEG69_13185 [Flavobacteriaceae bacterium]|jgi:H+/Cl- antiporter ClcA|nr:hypothetical protein [Flavobacteriaceae bacterium]|tara:strand:- start:33474 stop:33956 length:483 start_codon:yes stop_codon:yes gene_type:complete
MKPKYVTTIIKHIVIWTAAFFLWTLLRNYGQEVISDYNDISQFNQIATILVLGVIAGILFGVFEIVFERYVNRNMALGKLVLISSISYLTIIFTLIFCGGYLFHEISGETFYWQNYKEIMFSKQVILLLVYFFIIITLTSLFNEIDKRLGQGNLWKLLKG